MPVHAHFVRVRNKANRRVYRIGAHVNSNLASQRPMANPIEGILIPECRRVRHANPSITFKVGFGPFPIEDLHPSFAKCLQRMAATDYGVWATTALLPTIWIYSRSSSFYLLNRRSNQAIAGGTCFWRRLRAFVCRWTVLWYNYVPRIPSSPCRNNVQRVHHAGGRVQGSLPERRRINATHRLRMHGGS